MSKHVIGDRVRTKTMQWFRNNKIVTMFCPQIEVDGRLMFISDKTTKSGIIECETRQQAKMVANNKRDKSRKGLGDE